MQSNKYYQRSFTVVVTIAVLLVLSCTENKDIFVPKDYPELYIDGQTTLSLGKATESMSITIANAGEGSLDWSASTNKAWLKVNPSSGTIEDRGDKIEISVDKSGLSVGKYSGVVTIQSEWGNAILNVSKEVESGKWLQHDDNSFIDGITLTGNGWLWTRFTRPSGWNSVKVSKVQVHLWKGSGYTYDIDGFDSSYYENGAYFPNGSYSSLKKDASQSVGWQTFDINKSFYNNQFFIALWMSNPDITYFGYDTTDYEAYVMGYTALFDVSCYAYIVLGIRIFVEPGGLRDESITAEDGASSEKKLNPEGMWLEPEIKTVAVPKHKNIMAGIKTNKNNRSNFPIRYK